MNNNFYQHLDPDIKAILLAQIRNLWTHYSTSLEGNSLTLGETDFILAEGLTIQGKPLKDHNEVYGHAKAIEVIYALLQADTISAEDVFRLHETVLTERIINQPIRNERLMEQWLARLNASLAGVWSREQAAVCYADLQLSFVTIHPFFDGNGRLARLLANLPVLKSGFVPIVVPQEDRYRYKLTLSAYQNTVVDLADLNDLARLPDNAEKQAFVELCQGYWAETLALLDKANKMQEKRNHEK